MSHVIDGLRRGARSLWLVALGSAVLAGLLINWGQSPTGYSAGNNDHSVLSVQGIQWADPTRFVNDWFLEAAPQPHWFFDIVTYLGALGGSVAVAYLLFWFVGLAAFGLATALLSVAFVPRAPWLPALGFTLVITQTPWNVVGSGSTMIAEALPTVVAGNVVYLLLACLLTGRQRAAAVVAVAVSILHVQQGAVVVVMLVAVVVVRIVTDRRPPWALLAGTAGAGVAVAFGLALRPVAANLADFVEVCDTIIPYHCAAHTWPAGRVFAFVGFLVLALLSIRLFARPLRWVWAATVGLAVVGLWIGMAVDVLDVPVLGELAQATNVYRLGVVLLPFAVWGILSPLLRPDSLVLPFSRSRPTAVVPFVGDLPGRLLFIVWLIGLGLYFLLEGWPTGGRTSNGILLVVVAALVILTGLRIRTSLGDAGRALTIGISAALAGTAFVVTAFVVGGAQLRGFSPEFVTNPAIRAWGEEVERVVPSGETILVPPLSHTVRLVSGRADVVDCKNVPYGGAAWDEWRERIDRLGGPQQCLNPAAATYDRMSAVDLVSVADDYGARYLLVGSAQFERIGADLDTLGWEVVLEAGLLDAVVVGNENGGG